MALVNAVKDTNGNNGLSTGRGAGQTLAKAHSWLVPTMPYPPATRFLNNATESLPDWANKDCRSAILGKVAGGKSVGLRCGRG